MAQKFISPAVFTTEIDQSFLEQGVAGIGATIIGRFKDGPAFEPTPVGNFQEAFERFGDLDPLHPAMYAARNYLKNAGVANLVRVLGHDDGGDSTPGFSVGGITGIVDVSGSTSLTGSVLAIIYHSGSANVVNVKGVPTDANKFTFTIGSYAATASFLTSSAEYIGKVLNTNPLRYATDGHYVDAIFKYAQPRASASWTHVAMSGALNALDYNYVSGSTTWVKSQLLGGQEYNLFRFHTLAHGRVTNDKVKVTVRNVRPSLNPDVTPWGTFDVVVRKFYDSDLRPEVLESFANLTLDPADRNYIARRIGDQYEDFDTSARKFVLQGDYRNRSKHVRVELLQNSGAPAEAVPWGFRGYAKMLFTPVSGAVALGLNTVPELPYVVNQKDANETPNTNICWGVLFVSGGIADRMRAFPNLDTAAKVALKTTDTDFSMKHLSASYEGGVQRYSYNTSVTAYSPVFLSASLQKFTLPFQGGFDGFDVRVEDPLYLANSAGLTNIGVASLVRAIDCIADPDFIDTNLMAIPGIHNVQVTNRARTVANERADMVYIMDLTGSTVGDAVDQLKSRNIDDNYCAAYYPDLKMDDKINNRVVRVPPSVAVLGAIAYSDRVGQVFFAPAGLNRGGLKQFDVVDVVDRLNYQDRSDLYDNRINPIASFPAEGIVVFGQKTLQVAASALDRLNVRRLLIFAKKTIASAAKYLLFEPNNPATYQRFINVVNPILERVRQNQGIERFQVVMDTNLNTPDVVDRNVMIGKIFLQPTKTAEFIDLQFIITNAGVQFAE